MSRLASHRELGDKRGIAVSLLHLAQLLFVSQGDQAALRDAIGVPIPRNEQENYDDTVTTIRSGLGELDFTLAWSKGQATSPEQAYTNQAHEPSPPLTPTATTATTTHIYPAGLTARQIQVLRLLSRGMTNSEIARELELSEKTVAHHLTHIFNKTNSANRAAAVAFAIHHGLA